MKLSVILRFAIIGLLWLGVCVWYAMRIHAAGREITFVTLFPVLASGIIIFVPIYKKYVKNGGSKRTLK